jgi:prepilin signal peptidase PulO-like enzyme (type II secretory pathway)
MGELLLWGVCGMLLSAALGAVVVRTKETLQFATRRTCSVCAVPARPVDLFPVAGYVAMHARCYRCNAVQPWQYLLIDVAAGVIFWWLAVRAGVNVGTLFLGVAAILLCYLAWFDYRANHVPERLVLPAAILALLGNWWLGAPLFSVLFGGLLLGSFAAVQHLLSERLMSGGEVRLHVAVGFFLGVVGGIYAVAVSYLLGALVGIFLLRTRKAVPHGHVPHAFFLIISALALLFVR